MPTSARRSLPISAGSPSIWMTRALRREAVELAGGAVVEARADADQQIAFVDRHVGGARAVHAEHAEEVLRRRSAGRRGPSASRPRGCRSARRSRAARARPGRWRCRRRNRGSAPAPRRSARWRAAISASSSSAAASAGTSHVGGHAPAFMPTSLGRSISTGPGRPVRAMRKASAKICGMSSVRRTTKLCFTIGRVIPKMSTSWKASVPISGRRHLAGDRDHRHAVEEGVGDAGDEIGRARPRGRDADAGLAGDAAIGVGGQRRRLLVADEDVLQARARQRVVDRHDRAARIAEDVAHALALQRLDDQPRAGDRLRTASAGGTGRRAMRALDQAAFVVAAGSAARPCAVRSRAPTFSIGWSRSACAACAS